MSRAFRLIPIILVVWILITFAWRLIQPSDTAVRSLLVNREVPEFALKAATPERAGFNSAELATGEPRLLNFFASWCVPCVAEAPILERLKAQGVKIDGIAVRDTPGAVAAFLERNGNPYERIGLDPNSGVQLALGSSGVPETFVIDGKGVIRYQFIGPIGSADTPTILKQLRAAK
ncbi:DsbE family thiol:disulfide interchange protein [Sphingomonas daechungensis]|uniref:DsbE family thiol:disulfide interchange protein n=1 Tax=Sphingomonas daechungensis TaxID=1176646 RepID=UPI003783EB76